MINLQNNIPTLFEPKMANRWLVKFPDNFNINEMFIHQTSRPSFKVDIHGAIIWNEIEFSFYDPIGPSTTQQLFRLMQCAEPKSILNILKDLIKLKPSSKPLYDSDKGFTYHLVMLDPTGIEVEKWEISECKIIEINFGELSYKENGLVIPRMKIQPGKVNLLY